MGCDALPVRTARCARLTLRALLAAALLLNGGAAWAQEKIERFYGYAFDLKTDRYLYTEAHRQRIVDGRWVDGAIRYYTPDGALIGSKTLDFGKDPFVPVYRFDLPGQGYFEAITAVGERIEMAKRSASGKAIKTASVPHDRPMCGDSGFHACLYANFKQLMSGEPFNFLFAVAGNLDRYRFRARRIGDGEFEGRPVARFRVEPDSALRFFVDPLEVSYDPERRKLLEYRGISNLHDPDGEKPYVVRIAYYSQPPAVAGKLPPLP